MNRSFGNRPPEPGRRWSGRLSQAFRVLLGLLHDVLRRVLAYVVDIALFLVCLVLWFRSGLFWLGVVAVIIAVSNHEMAPAAWHWQLAGGVGGIGLIAISRAAILAYIRLRIWQQRLHRRA